MSQTIVEKIFSNHLGEKHYAGEYVVVEPDAVINHEGSGAIAINIFKELNLKTAKYPKRIPFIIAHSAPSINKVISHRHIVEVVDA